MPSAIGLIKSVEYHQAVGTLRGVSGELGDFQSFMLTLRGASALQG